MDFSKKRPSAAPQNSQMGSCNAHDESQEIDPNMPMWVLKLSDFITMELPLPKHEILQRRGLLHLRETSFYCVFVSHQWIANLHPDPDGEQLRVLQRCLKNIIDGNILVTNDAASQFLGEMKKLSQIQRAKIRDSYLWMDWISIPQDEIFEDQDFDLPAEWLRQHSTNSSGPNRSFAYRSKTQNQRRQEFILSLPSFVQASQAFVALVPPIPHRNTGKRCNFASWMTRGWCRTELFCKMMLGNQDLPVVVVSAPDLAHFARPANWVDCLPFEGEFSYHDDKSVVSDIFDQAVSHQLEWLKNDRQVSLYRYYLARRESLVGKSHVQRTMNEFLEHFGYKSLEIAKRDSGLGPVCFAALSEDSDLLQVLLEAKCSMDRPLQGIPGLGIAAGLTPLHLAVLQAWRSPRILQVLLEARANPNLTAAAGVPLLACCRTARDVELLVQYRAAVNGKYPPLNVPVLALASGESKPEVIAKLLECRGSPNCLKAGGGLGGAQPLAFVALSANFHTHALEVADLLLTARADVNFQCQAGGIFRIAELTSRAYLQIAQPRSLLMLVMAEWSTTPLGFACLYGNSELVEFFLEARADVNAKNARGHVPMDLATSEEIKLLLSQAAEGHQPQQVPREPTPRHILAFPSTAWLLTSTCQRSLSFEPCQDGAKRKCGSGGSSFSFFHGPFLTYSMYWMSKSFA